MNTATVNISFRKDLLESIDAAARRECRTRSELIREAARSYIDNNWGRSDKTDYTYNEPYTAEDKIKVGIFDSLVIDLKDIFME